MADRNDIDVFVSYDHADRQRVQPLVESMKAKGWSIWWDTDIDIGSKWRHVLEDRLDHARAVCVVWTRKSVGSDFVCSEAARANVRGVLLPIRLDPVDQPLGFGEIQYADMSDPERAGDAFTRLLNRIESLIGGVAPVATWQADVDNDYSVNSTRNGLDAAREFLGKVRALSDTFSANPGAASGLQSALDGVRDTYAVVGDAIDEFLAPVVEQSPITLGVYRPLADGRLATRIARGRGHCKRIAQVYIESGGLRDSLPESVGQALVDELDDLILDLSTADGDLFNAMGEIGTTLQTQAAIVTNLLLAGQAPEATARLTHVEHVLLPMRQEVNRGMADVERLAADLGLAL